MYMESRSFVKANFEIEILYFQISIYIRKENNRIEEVIEE